MKAADWLSDDDDKTDDVDQARRDLMSSLELTPLAAAARLAGRRGRILLHSARDDDGLGAWSFAAAEPSATLIARGRSLVRLDEYGRPAQRFTGDPFDAAEAFLAEHGCTIAPRTEGPPEARVIGFFGYDLARVIEQLPGGPTLGQDVPDLWLAAYGSVARSRGSKWQSRQHIRREWQGSDPSQRNRY